MAFLTRFFSRLRVSKRVRFCFFFLAFGIGFFANSTITFSPALLGVGGLTLLTVACIFFPL